MPALETRGFKVSTARLAQALEEWWFIHHKIICSVADNSVHWRVVPPDKRPIAYDDICTAFVAGYMAAND